MRSLARRFGIGTEEQAAVIWSWLFFFSVLTSYYVIRPIRDDMGVAGGVSNLPWLFTGSLVGMLAANPAFAYLVTRLPRPTFISWSYRFFAINLIVFFAVLQLAQASQLVWVGRVFFVWTAVFNMWAVSMFWSVMTDVFTTGQGKRLFGLIGAAGTIGAITGAGLTSLLVHPIGAANLLLISAGLLELSALCARRVFLLATTAPDAAVSREPHPGEVAPIGGSVWEGLKRSLTTAYFVNITLHMLLFTVLTTFLYFQQAALVDAAITDRAERTQFFANIDLAVNVITLVTQTVATGWIVQTFGLAVALAFLPAVSVVGFAVLGLHPTIATLMTLQVIRRAGNFAIARPAREVLFTVVPAADRYKTKSFIDTFIYRAGDQIGAWAYFPMAALGLGIPGVSAVAVGLAAVSVVNAVWLARRLQERVLGSAGREQRR